MRERTLWLIGFVLVAIALAVRLSVRERLVSIPAIRPAPQPIVADRLSYTHVLVGTTDPNRQVSSTQSVVVGTFEPLIWHDEATRQRRLGGAIITPPNDATLERHPSTIIFGLPGFPNAYIRDTLMRHDSDYAAMLPLSMPNDWDPSLHGPEQAPGSCEQGQLQDGPDGFPGVFDRDLLFRSSLDRAPQVAIVHDHTHP